MKVSLSALALLLLAFVTPLMADDQTIVYTPINRPTQPNSHVLFDQVRVRELGRALKQAALPSGNGIDYHGGPIMTNTVTIYYIWYGNWNGNSGVTLLESFAKNLGGSPYYNINTTYTDGAGAAVKNNLIFGGSVVDNYSLGKNLTDAQVWQAVSTAISSGKFPADPNAVYFLLTSADVNATSGFCQAYCGWHTYRTLNTVPIKYAFVGDAGRCPSGCSAQATKSPNNNVGADGMALVLAHELGETVSDPQLNGWWDSASGGESGDKCAWTFGVTSLAANGSRYNLTVGGTNYLIQQNWLNSGGGGCVMHYVPPTITAVSPASGVAGSNVNVALTGSNFVSGANFAISGVGVTTTNLSVVSATQMTATLTIAASADLGVHNITVTQGLAHSVPAAFAVTSGGFSLTQVAPATVATGATVPITLTGTGFASGATVAVAGSGLSVSNVKVVSATQMTASLVVASSVIPSSYSLSVSQGGVASAPLPFSVTSTGITLATITPSSISAGGTAKITLAGKNFPAGASVSVSGSGITVTGTTVVSATQIIANLAVGASTAIGSRNVTVSLGSNSSQASTLTITAPPNFNSLSPAAGAAGTTTKITIAGTNFAPGTNVAVTGTGVTVNGVTIVTPSQMTANLVIDKAAPLGPRSISLSFGTASTTGATFNVVAQPTVSLLTPSSGGTGTTVKVTLTGTNFVPASTVAIDGSGVTSNAGTYVSATQMTANLVIDPTAAVGTRNLTVSTSAVPSAPAAFTVTSNAPTLASLSPASSAAGSTANVTLTGTRFTSGNTIAVSGTGVTVSNITVVSPTQITARFAIDLAAAPGARSVTLSNGATTTSAVPLTITAAPVPPVLTSLDKTTGAAGSAVSVTATGTSFTSSTKLIFSGAGITVGNLRVISPTQLTASLVIASTAPTGARAVTLSNTNATANGVNFTITAAVVGGTGPTVTGLSPAAGILGQALITTLNGTGFTPNSTVSSGDPNIPVIQTTYVSETQFAVVLGLGGTVGSHPLTVSAGSSTSSNTSAPVNFTIVAPPPPNTSDLTPTSGAVGKTVTVSIQGSNFAPGMLVGLSGTGVTVGNITTAGPNTVTIPLTISSGAPLGARSLSITTPGGVSNAQTFTITAKQL